MSAIDRDDALEAILSKLAEREEPCPPWIYATIRKCLDDLPGLPTTEPLVHDGFYLCDKKPGACPSWERKGWTKCMSKHCNRTSRVDHALKLPDDGWIPCSKRLPKEHRKVWVTTKWGEVTDGKRSCIPNIWFIRAGNWNAHDNEIIAWKPYSCPKPYESKESET